MCVRQDRRLRDDPERGARDGGNSPPDRRLREAQRLRARNLLHSPPDRRLRDWKRGPNSTAPNSPPDRRLRELLAASRDVTSYSPPDRQLRESRSAPRDRLLPAEPRRRAETQPPASALRPPRVRQHRAGRRRRRLHPPRGPVRQPRGLGAQVPLRKLPREHRRDYRLQAQERPRWNSAALLPQRQGAIRVFGLRPRPCDGIRARVAGRRP